MLNLRCPKCSAPNGKQEGNILIIRTGYGNKRSYHAFDIVAGTMTCWNCKEVINIRRNVDGRITSEVRKT